PRPHGPRLQLRRAGVCGARHPGHPVWLQAVRRGHRGPDLRAHAHRSLRVRRRGAGARAATRHSRRRGAGALAQLRGLSRHAGPGRARVPRPASRPHRAPLWALSPAPRRAGDRPPAGAGFRRGSLTMRAASSAVAAAALGGDAWVPARTVPHPGARVPRATLAVLLGGAAIVLGGAAWRHRTMPLERLGTALVVEDRIDRPADVAVVSMASPRAAALDAAK